MKYCESIYSTKRRVTREVLIGNVGVGGNNPIRIQSMTTSNTRDIPKTIDQIIRLADTGCEIARITVQGIKEADACEQIKNGLLQRGCQIPLVADIHFYPPAALRVVDFVDKVRINPGNFVDKRASFKVIEYDDESYLVELDKIEEKFTPLIEKCKRLKRAMRIGTNHGSLSDRIMNRFGDSPKGMVESALEFARLCRKNDYHDFMFSMKSSNPQVMILAYRLLAAEMYKLEWDYPLHLGVTEAGDGEDGRIKSAMGIGALLLEGLGDTIRVSLTEDPWHEIDPCQRIIQFAEEYRQHKEIPFVEYHRDILAIKRRHTVLPQNIALHRDGSVMVSVTEQDLCHEQTYIDLGFDTQFGKPKIQTASIDSLVVNAHAPNSKTKEVLQTLQAVGTTIISKIKYDNNVQILTIALAAELVCLRAKSELFSLNICKKVTQPIALLIQDEQEDDWCIIEQLKPSLIFYNPSGSRLFKARRLFEWLQEKKITIPVILNFSYTCNKEDFVIKAAAECGTLLCDGFGDGLLIEGPYEIGFIRHISFAILQAARMRTSKTDFISCPSCGRTLFDLQDVTKRIRSRTSHLPGVKIAIMGCIVNGPGEMADADFGYVGSKPGMIDLYVGKECIEKDITFDNADDRLIDLIKAKGRWIEP